MIDQAPPSEESPHVEQLRYADILLVTAAAYGMYVRNKYEFKMVGRNVEDNMYLTLVRDACVGIAKQLGVDLDLVEQQYLAGLKVLDQGTLDQIPATFVST